MTQASSQVNYPKRRASAPKVPKTRKAPKISRAWLVSIAVVAVALVAGGVVIATMFTGSGGSSANPTALMGVADNEALFAGIPQHGNVLGSPKAPVTLVEYADLQCPYCAYWSRSTFPVLVRDYVRPGRVKLVFRGLAFLGPDSVGLKCGATRAEADEWLLQYPDDASVMPYIGRSGWNTLRLGGAIPDDELREAVDASYDTVVAKLPKSRRPSPD